MSSIPSAADELYALVDCNNFYASCERVFDPSARNKPVVVLSNNDGCTIARSEEAKAVGIPMGAPFFKLRELVTQHDVRVFSSNYVLYGDMSNRVMTALREFTPNLEIYSIDEAFLLFKGFLNYDMNTYAHLIKDTVYRKTGLPVSVGVGRTKTLAKIANHLAKRVYQTGAFCLFADIDVELKKFPIEKIWGIGSGHRRWLTSQGVVTAYDFKNMQDRIIKKKMSVTGLRTAWELREISCLKIEELVPDRKAIRCSRMFGHTVQDVESLEEAVCSYTARAAVKLRRQNLMAGYIYVSIETSRFKDFRYKNGLGLTLHPPTAHSPTLQRQARRLLCSIYREGFSYNRAAVMLLDLSPERQVQDYFIGSTYPDSREQQLMKMLDDYNASVNHGKIHFASEGLKQDWQMKQDYKSPVLQHVGVKF